MIDFDNLIEWARRNQGEIVRMDAEVLRALRLARAADAAEKAMESAFLSFKCGTRGCVNVATEQGDLLKAALAQLREARNG